MSAFLIAVASDLLVAALLALLTAGVKQAVAARRRGGLGAPAARAHL